MKLQRREYQESAIVAVEAHYAADVRSVLLVAPTGSGKTELGCRIVGSRSALWVAHTRELVKQTAQRLRDSLDQWLQGWTLCVRSHPECGAMQRRDARGSPQ